MTRFSFFLLLLYACQPVVRSDEGGLAVINALVIDGSGKTAEAGQVLLIKNGQFIFAGDREEADIPENYTILDAQGKTIIPGIVGVHNHLHMPGMPFLGEQGAKLYLAAGVTTIQTCGSASPEDELLLARAVRKGNALGPEIIPSAPYITGPGGNQNMIIPRNSDHLRDTMRYWMDRGMRWFKVYRHVTPSDLAIVTEEAHRREAKVTGHLCSVTFREAIDLGIDGIEHGLNSAGDFRSDKLPGECGGGREYMDTLDPQGEEVRDLFHVMIRENVFMTSTLAIYESGIAGRNVPDDRTIALLVPELAEQFAQEEVSGLDTVREQRLKRIMAFEKVFHDMGGILVSGVDPGRHVLPGLGDQRNFELLVEAGYQTEEAIMIMTSNGAKVLGMENRGVIAAGKKADFVMLDGILTTDPGVIRNTVYVFRNGVRYDAQQLLTELTGKFGR